MPLHLGCNRIQTMHHRMIQQYLAHLGNLQYLELTVDLVYLEHLGRLGRPVILEPLGMLVDLERLERLGRPVFLEYQSFLDFR